MSRLSVWCNGTHWIVARSAADAAALLRTVQGERHRCESETCCDPFRRESDRRLLRISGDGIRGSDENHTMRVWIKKYGRGALASNVWQ